ALAWGPEGHAMIADMGEAHLTPAAAAIVHQLLQLEGDKHLDDISSWADANRKKMRGTGRWHYVDIPLHADAYDAARDCRHDDCVVAKLVSFTRVLGDTTASPAQRLLALKWVVHLVGDIHQPLHAEDNDDKGGNTVQLNYFGKGTNLHAIWDSYIIEHAFDLHLGPNYSFNHALVRRDALKLNAKITPQQRAQWAAPDLTSHLQSTVIAWANQSHALARDVAYADVPAKRKPGWAEAYQQKTWPVVQTQLERGGVRLAALLNQTLTSVQKSPAAKPAAVVH
ncbi:MAG: S1/P1 nuclease, partial [Xanthomonadales bacterium]|nr:S1/P1 nuclease [Xanthomonadales bacterium]